MSRRPKIDCDVLKIAYREAAEIAAKMERSSNYARACELWADSESRRQHSNSVSGVTHAKPTAKRGKANRGKSNDFDT